MNNILLIVTDYNQLKEAQGKYGRISLLLDRIFYKKRLIKSVSNNLIEIDVNNNKYNNENNNEHNNQKIFLIIIPKYYLEAEFYGKKGIEKSYNAKNLMIDKINLFCIEKRIERHFYSSKLLELYQVELQAKLASTILAYQKPKHEIQEYEAQDYKIQGEPINLGKVLFRALTLDILEKICSYKKIDLMQLDIAIVGNEENKEDLFRIVWRLSPLVKYITILISDKETAWLDSIVEEIYNITGLSVGVSNNFNTTVINSDVLINYNNVFELNSYQGLKRRTIVINNSLNDYVIGYEKPRFRNPLINSIEINLSEYFPCELESLIPGHFSTNQLVEILLGNKNGWIEEKMEESFKKEGFQIKGLLGFNMDFITKTYS